MADKRLSDADAKDVAGGSKARETRGRELTRVNRQARDTGKETKGRIPDRDAAIVTGGAKEVRFEGRESRTGPSRSGTGSDQGTTRERDRDNRRSSGK